MHGLNSVSNSLYSVVFVLPVLATFLHLCTSSSSHSVLACLMFVIQWVCVQKILKKRVCVQQKTKPVNACSLSGVFTVRRVLSYPQCNQSRLIRLHGCACCSEALLVVLVFLWVLLFSDSYLKLRNWLAHFEFLNRTQHVTHFAIFHGLAHFTNFQDLSSLLFNLHIDGFHTQNIPSLYSRFLCMHAMNHIYS